MCVCRYMPGLLAESGIADLKVPIAQHAWHYAVWCRYGALPERFDWRSKTPVVHFYPLRPELAESTYHLCVLFLALRNPLV